MIYFIPHKDIKTNLWVKNNVENSHVVELTAHPFFHFIIVLFKSFTSYKRPVYIFRYTNDHNSIFINLCRVVSDFLIIFVCNLLGGRVDWILHNIDKDSFVKYPAINKLRRKLIAQFCKKIFVTDEIIKREISNGAVPFFFKKSKLEAISFGENIKTEISDIDNDLRDIISHLKKDNPNLRVGLCASTYSEKCFHIWELEKLLNTLNSEREMVHILFICKIPSEELATPYFDRLKVRTDISFFPNGGEVNECYLSESIDFIYRALSDVSVPMSIYNACSANLPILTHPVGISKSLIESTGVGFCIDLEKKPDINLFISFLIEWDSRNSENFLSSRNWSASSKSLFWG